MSQSNPSSGLASTAPPGVLAPQQLVPYAWLYEIDIPTTPRTKARLTPYPIALQFGRDSVGNPLTFSPFALAHSETQTDTAANLNNVTLSAQNVTQEWMALLEAHRGLIGEKVRIRLVRVDEMPDGVPIEDEVYELLGVSFAEANVTAQLGQYSLQTVTTPGRRITRSHCAHAYGGVPCGYNAARVGALATCTKLRDGPLGCVAHGLDEAAAGLPNRHPQRILTFAGVLRTSGLGVA